MSAIVYLQSAFILHARPFRNTSLLLDLFTKDQGRIGAVARGVRGPRSKTQGITQPFIPLLISWSGRSELVTLRDVELEGDFSQLTSSAVLSGFYLNELLLRLLHKHDPHPELFAAYKQTLINLNQGPIELSLRLFEQQLLNELGYGLVLDEEAHSGAPIEADAHYHYQTELGFVRVALEYSTVPHSAIFCGQSLLAFQAGLLTEPTVLRDAKRLMRMALAPLLGPQPLKCRELFANW